VIITNTVKVLLRLKTSVIFAMVPMIGILLGAIPSAIAQQAGYNLTVYVRRRAIHSATPRITTESGYENTELAYSAQGRGVIFSIPP
jgi:ABC-type enterochelin transport system permease subunit